ncbi:Uncharacterised protein [Mycobacteroides abscessus subsp. abscessus]|uniref:hypothetical protein n=1 Tax=Mycobacteroides abscessus TaxID=36809 RepID=UPI0009CB3998|nr:hypothetical protein [Mycobacteroides abscessus]SLD05585.1 Uncharacterised protein [Mycobacteroides abscessus subsp. abscessus]SLH60045.1 Uncharacterised protein [Mycobacteroides abscessus subsp. abscessus]SLH80672.1 Uncharacterised protein [Mycobacteroides abscessus subsp. abscessus]
MRNSLTALVLALGVGVSTIGCSASSTPTAPLSSTISTTASAHALVDVAAVWQTEPLPDCPKPLIVFNGAVPPGLSLPDKASVARQLAGVKSPASEGWVRTKLGWVTQELASTRAGIIDTGGTDGARAQAKDFQLYVEHVRAELQAGKDIPSDLDSTFPEGCA